MWRSRGIASIAVVVVVAITLGASRPPAGATVVGGSTPQRAMARWAVGRFVDEGYTLPRVEIRFHLDRDGCGGRMGAYHDAIADLCYVHTSPMASRTLLHEMAHGWLEANVSSAVRDRFLAFRGLRTWNDPGAVWDERGFEHAAEIIAWALGDQRDGIYLPSFADNEPERLIEAYELVTGLPFPALRPGMRWPDD